MWRWLLGKKRWPASEGVGTGLKDGGAFTREQMRTRNLEVPLEGFVEFVAGMAVELQEVLFSEVNPTPGDGNIPLMVQLNNGLRAYLCGDSVCCCAAIGHRALYEHLGESDSSKVVEQFYVIFRRRLEDLLDESYQTLEQSYGVVGVRQGLSQNAKEAASWDMKLRKMRHTVDENREDKPPGTLSVKIMTLLWVEACYPLVKRKPEHMGKMLKFYRDSRVEMRRWLNAHAK